jgi:hypothetical protein
MSEDAKGPTGFTRTINVNARSVKVSGFKQEDGAWRVSACCVSEPVNIDDQSWRFFKLKQAAVNEGVAAVRLEVTSPTLERALEAAEALADRVGHLAVTSDSLGRQDSDRRRGWS